MTVIKFEKDNKTYTLLSKTTKVTTPSIRIGNNYTPLFEGKPESEVISGDTITLQNHSGPTSFIVVFYGAYQVQMC